MMTRAQSTDLAWLVPLATLTAAVVGLLAAGLAALINSNATAIITQRRSVEEQHDAVLEQLGRMQASRIAMTIEDYRGIPAAAVATARDASIEDFFRSYRHETFELRARLSSLNRQDGTVGRIVNQETAEIEKSDIPLIRQEVLAARTEELHKLGRWWLRPPKS